MLSRPAHVGGFAVAVVGMALGAEFGDEAVVALAYGLAVALGVVLYLQGDSYATSGSTFGNALVGYLAGIASSLVLATALLMWFVGAPWDLGAWQLGLQLWDSWAGVGVAMLSGFFVTGLLGLLA